MKAYKAQINRNIEHLQAIWGFLLKVTEVRFRRRTSHESNRMLIRENKGFFSFAFDSAMWRTASELGLKMFVKIHRMKSDSHSQSSGGDNSNKRCFGSKPKLFRESGEFSGNRDTWNYFRETLDNSGTLQKKIGTSKEFLFHVFIRLTSTS